MSTVCECNQCVGCYACVNACARDAITLRDEVFTYNAYIDKVRCVECGKCRVVCPKMVQSTLAAPITWRQGWIRGDRRRFSSSGGAAQAIMRAFIRTGGLVASCLFEDREFVFRVVRDEAELCRFLGSKYVKSHAGTIYSDVVACLRSGQRVLFVGLPCQVAALKNVMPANLADRLYTVDLICHGAPSQAMLRKALSDYGVRLNDLKDISFREKTSFNLRVEGKTLVPEGMYDAYTMSFIKGLIYTNGCYTCQFAQTSRVADLTLGDSWGTELKDEEKRGISLLICCTEKGEKLIDLADLMLQNVDLERAIASNHQLSHPSRRPSNYEKMMKELMKKSSFRRTVIKYSPVNCAKQHIKRFLFKISLYKKRYTKFRDETCH